MTEPGLVVLRSEETAEYWEGRIRPHLAGAVEHIVAAGLEFIEARKAVHHGEFGRLAELLRMDGSTVRRFMLIAEHEVIANRAHGHDLPPSWRTLYELSRLPAPALEAAIEAGDVRPDMERKDAMQVVARYGIAARERPADEPAVPPVEGAFPTITADPPWKYDNRATRAAAADHYPTLTVEEIRGLEVDGLPVKERAADGAHLYLWVTNAFLHDGFDILADWGFTYKTCLTWVKPQLGIGNYFRSSTEHVLFGIRGDLKVLDSNQRNWFEWPRGRHSRKPDPFYDLVERVSPGPYLELFGRPDMWGPRPGWTVWGNEA